MRALIACAGLLTACATTPEQVLELADVERDDDRVSAVARAAGILEDRRARFETRAAAAKVLGRLRSADQVTIAALSSVLKDPEEAPDLRSFAAWALGELRSPDALDVLTAALKTPLSAGTGERVLEGLIKHHAIAAPEPERFVEIVEAMVQHSATQRDGLSPLYDLLGARTRTVPVNVRVLSRAIDRAKSGGPADRAAMYTAAFELLTGLEASRNEIVAGASTWSARVNEAIKAAARASSSGDRETALLVLWYLGRIGDLQELGHPAASALITTRPLLASEPRAVRFLSVWALGKMQLHALGARRALLQLLAVEKDPEVLRLIAALSSRPEEHDLLQKLAGVE